MENKLKELERHIYRITENNTLTVSFSRMVSAKELFGMIKMCLRKCNSHKQGIEALFFGDGEWIQDQQKKSFHYHIAFLCELTKEQRTCISQGIRHFAKKLYIGDTDIVERWVVRHTIPYLLQHGVPFYKRF